MPRDLKSLFPEMFPLIRYPEGFTEESLKHYLKGFHLNGEDSAEFNEYLENDFKRFVYTLNILPEDQTGKKLLEMGSNPYFTSILLVKFTKYLLNFANFISIHFNESTEFQLNRDTNEKIEFKFVNHNIEESQIPTKYKFDVILFCEVLEHLIKDPIKAIVNLKNALEYGGHLILTTPNVNRLENIAKMMNGENIYDPYSAYGEYGRHNREYNVKELELLLTHLGFEIEEIFTADVHENYSDSIFPVKRIRRHIKKINNRKYGLGQYIFLRARNVKPIMELKPSWLYRSYPSDELC